MSRARSVRCAAGVACVAAVTTLAACGSEVVVSSGGVAGSASTTSTTSTSSSTGKGGPCAAPTSAISSLEAVALARCVIPGGEQARLLGYATLIESTFTAPGTYANWDLVFQDDETTYIAVVGVDVLAFYPWALPQPECTPPSVPTLDSMEIVPAAMEALQAPEDYPPGLLWYRHALSCLDWGAEGYAVVSTDWSWEHGDEWSSYHAVFSPDGELLLLCGPCYSLIWTSCCEPP